MMANGGWQFCYLYSAQYANSCITCMSHIRTPLSSMALRRRRTAAPRRAGISVPAPPSPEPVLTLHGKIASQKPKVVVVDKGLLKEIDQSLTFSKGFLIKKGNRMMLGTNLNPPFFERLVLNVCWADHCPVSAGSTEHIWWQIDSGSCNVGVAGRVRRRD
ncbi:hypothetical protein J6590_001042 [Homalodisca vitripennis]|nr:hypothetical protein J6590_001042 [Homalodisca vitripennis]